MRIGEDLTELRCALCSRTPDKHKDIDGHTPIYVREQA